MIDEKFEKLLAGFIEGSHTEADKKELEAAITSGELEIDTVADLQLFNNKLSAVPVPEPSENMRVNFYQMLALEKQKGKAKNAWKNWITTTYENILNQIPVGKLAYSLVVLCVGIGLGSWFNERNNPENQKLADLTTEMQQMKKMMLVNLLEQPSATDRLKAVSLTTDLETPDNKVIRSLLETLNNDPSVNVRLATIEALYQHADNPVAREGLVNAINKQDSPLVQLTLADIMVAMQEKASVKQLRQLLKKNNLNKDVKTKVEQSIQVLI